MPPVDVTGCSVTCKLVNIYIRLSNCILTVCINLIIYILIPIRRLTCPFKN